MGDLGRFLLDVAQFVWPFRLVHAWERGGYFVCGIWWKEVGPGLKFVIPWFCDVMTVNVVPALVGTGREDVTLSDGRPLSYSAMATVEVFDVKLALTAIDSYHESTQELLRSFLSEQFALEDTARIQPEKRKAYIKKLLGDIDKETRVFGVTVNTLRFPSFVLGARVYRLLTDQETPGHW